MICQRCGLEGAIDIDTGSKCHAELGECIALLLADRERLLIEVAETLRCVRYHNRKLPGCVWPDWLGEKVAKLIAEVYQ